MIKVQVRIIAALLFFSYSFASAQNRSSLVAIENCLAGNSPAKLVSEDFRWGYSLPELISRFTEIYSSEKRLQKRAYWDSKNQVFKLPYDSNRGGDVVLPLKLVESVRNHIEAGFEMKVIDGVFFPDMGHSHFLIPIQKYQEIYDPFPVNQLAKFYETLLADSDLKVLYHTAEQLKTRDENNQVLPDERIQFRFRTRNLVGRNDGSRELLFLQNPESVANTAHDLEGHRYYGAGFNLSANQNGCFRYTRDGKDSFFDLSLYDLESENGGFNPKKSRAPKSFKSESTH